MMTFSVRTTWDLTEENPFTQQISAARKAGRALYDLTLSNPTDCGFSYESDLLAPLSSPAAEHYVPVPFGMEHARNAVAAYYGHAAPSLSASHICLTTSTSEAYSFLFRLLCDPEDEVLIARPSYPLFEFIAQLDAVRLREFELHYELTEERWRIDFHSLAQQRTEKTRAVIVVHPNNPTGNFIDQQEREALQAFCAEQNLALIVDEVFLDYGMQEPQPSFVAGEAQALTFVLSGLSKVCGLPQMKASWIVTRGPEALVQEALARLEVIADTFLSMNAPVQFALESWLAKRSGIQSQIRERMHTNLQALDERLQGSAAHRLRHEGGWTVVLRVPRVVGETPFAEAALEAGVITQPGEFYGLPAGRIVLSLLTPPSIWREGIRALPVD